MKKFSEEEIEKMLDEYESETLIYRMYTGKGVEQILGAHFPSSAEQVAG